MIFNAIGLIIFIFALVFTIKNVKKSFIFLIVFYFILPVVIATRTPFFLTFPRIYFLGFLLVYFFSDWKKIFRIISKNKFILFFSLYTA